MNEALQTAGWLLLMAGAHGRWLGRNDLGGGV